MSIIPGIETGAPLRTETSSGSRSPPNVFPGTAFELGHSALDVGLEAVGHPPAEPIELEANLGRDREARRHRKARARHIRQPRALATEEVAHLAAALFEEV